MTRTPRHTQTGEWHHVMNRGARRLPVFGDDLDRQRFLEMVDLSRSAVEIEIHAYALLENHYHLLLRGPIVMVSEFMRLLGGDYTARFNRRYGLDGALFRGRFRSKPVQKDTHLKELVRYIHRNPLIGAATPTIQRLRWTSHPSYVGVVHRPWWLQTERILSMFAGDLHRYRRWVEGEEGELTPLRPIATSPRPRPCSPADIDKAVGISSPPEQLLVTSVSQLRRRHRDAAVLLCSELVDRPAHQLAAHFDLGSGGAFRAAASRARTRSERDPDLQELVHNARMRLIGHRRLRRAG